MNTPPPPLRDTLHEILLLILFCGLIAIFTNLIRDGGLLNNLIFSEAIGISIYGTIKLLIRRRGGRRKEAIDVFIGVPLGGLIGIAAGSLLTGIDPAWLLAGGQNELAILAASAIIFGTAISYFFYSRNRLNEQRLQLQAQERRRSEYEKRLMEGRLRLLQAQIEPHFLFNTLANVISLIDECPAEAKMILERLGDFLRTSLQRSRSDRTSVTDEVQLLNAYLTIQQARMGERLQFEIDCPERLSRLPLPPLLVQPLVENAVLHGLEGKVAGGSVRVRFRQYDDGLEITVRDDGMGIREEASGGIGLINVRERLRALYGDTARLDLESGDSGTSARLLLPLEQRR